MPESALRLLTPLDALSVYQWHTRSAKDYFCPTCGILLFRRPRANDAADAEARGVPHFAGWAVNIRCLDGIDLEAIPRVPISGSRLP